MFVLKAHIFLSQRHTLLEKTTQFNLEGSAILMLNDRETAKLLH